MVTKNMEKIGEYAFLAGVAIAVLAALGSAYAAEAIASVSTWVPLVLVVLGVAVGLLNISEKESTSFLVAAIALVTASTASFAGFNLAGLGALLDSIVGNIAVLVSPAAVIVAVKAVYNLASGR